MVFRAMYAVSSRWRSKFALHIRRVCAPDP